MKLAQIKFGELEEVATPEFGAGAKIGDLVSTLLPFFYVGAGLLLLIYLILGGLQFMLSLGDPKKMQDARGKITNALIGFLIVFISYWLVQIIGRIFGIEAIVDIFG